MKTLQKLIIILLVLSASGLMAQTALLHVYGAVYQTSGNPFFPDHKVYFTVYPDSLNPSNMIIDSTTTNQYGEYNWEMNVPWTPGVVVPFLVSTYDCEQNIHQVSRLFYGDTTTFPVYFSICGDSLPPNCNNYFIHLGTGGTTASFEGYMAYPQSASYQWSFGDGTSGSGQSITHTFPTQGVYPVSLMTTTPQGCTYVFTSNILINDSTSPSICDNYITLNSINNLFVAFTGGMVNQQTATYNWNFGDGNTAAGSYTEHMYQYAGTYTVSLTTTTLTNCTDISYYQVTVNDSLPLNCDNNFQPYISSLSVYYYGWLVNQQSATYHWSFGDGTFGSGQSLTHVYSNPGIYTVSLTTVTSDSCVDVTYQTITLIDSTILCTNYFIAQAGTGLMEINFQGFHQPQIPATFSWNFGDQTTGTGQTINHTYATAGNYLVTLTSTDTTGCTSQSDLQVMVGTYNYSLLQGRVFANGQSITQCQVQLYSQDPNGAISLIQTTVPDSANYYFFQQLPSGIYYILATPFAGSSYASQFLPTYYGDEYLWENSTAIMLGVAANPYDINLATYDSISGGTGSINGQINTGGKSVLLAGQEVLLMDNAGNVVRITYTDSQGNYTFESLPLGDYQVYPNITGISTVPANVQLTVISPTATVNMTISGGTITGITEYRESLLISRMYPNPATDHLSIELSKASGSILVEILDSFGRIIHSKIITSSGSEKLSLDLQNYVPGMYILRSTDASGNVSNQKFLKK